MKKLILHTFLSIILLGLTACTKDKAVINTTSVVSVYPPDSLLVHPCKAKPPGESLLDLARGYNKNTSCIGLYKLQLDKIIENKKKQRDLYNVK